MASPPASPLPPSLHSHLIPRPSRKAREGCSRGLLCILMLGALALLGCVLWLVIQGTRRCPRGHARYQLRRKLLGVVSRDYAVLDAGNAAWAAAAGAFPRQWQLTLASNRTRVPLRMACSGITSCLNLYPTYDITTDSGGPHGTLRQQLDLVTTYALALSTGAAYSAELDPLASIVSTRYTVKDRGGRAVAQIQKELGGCSFHGSEPGLSACFKVCVADDQSQSGTALLVVLGIAIDQNHP